MKLLLQNTVCTHFDNYISVTARKKLDFWIHWNGRKFTDSCHSMAGCVCVCVWGVLIYPFFQSYTWSVKSRGNWTMLESVDRNVSSGEVSRMIFISIINCQEIHLTWVHFSALRRHEAALTKFQISLKSLKLSVATPAIRQSWRLLWRQNSGTAPSITVLIWW